MQLNRYLIYIYISQKQLCFLRINFTTIHITLCNKTTCSFRIVRSMSGSYASISICFVSQRQFGRASSEKTSPLKPN
jgi:hypothetical protein